MTTMPVSMIEATILYSTTAVVVAALAVWVVVVLTTAKEPWARAIPVAAGATTDFAGDVTERETPIAKSSPPPKVDDAPKSEG